MIGRFAHPKILKIDIRAGVDYRRSPVDRS